MTDCPRRSIKAIKVPAVGERFRLFTVRIANLSFLQYRFQIPEQDCLQLLDSFFLLFGTAGNGGMQERFDQLN
jgi:hypothetical protein